MISGVGSHGSSSTENSHDCANSRWRKHMSPPSRESYAVAQPSHLLTKAVGTSRWPATVWTKRAPTGQIQNSPTKPGSGAFAAHWLNRRFIHSAETKCKPQHFRERQHSAQAVPHIVRHIRYKITWYRLDTWATCTCVSKWMNVEYRLLKAFEFRLIFPWSLLALYRLVHASTLGKGIGLGMR